EEPNSVEVVKGSVVMFGLMLVPLVEPPTIQEKPEVVRVTRGDPVCLECRVAGSPQISVGWSKDGKELQSSRKYQLLYEQNCSRLNIKSTEADDAGEYEFRASNSIGTCTCKITLMVLGLSLFVSEQLLKEEILPPTFIKKLKNIQAVMDSVVTIEGRQKISEGFKYKLLQLENTVSLELKLSESSDTGEYSCKVWNSAGSCVSSAVLTAKGQSSDVNAITCRNRALGCITASVQPRLMHDLISLDCFFFLLCFNLIFFNIRMKNTISNLINNQKKTRC
uniref:Ig-like domain-containing protein n=1 Tax=Sphaeramia orbicularis TaxID=375764 RepID=A0A673ARS2_9TELE